MHSSTHFTSLLRKKRLFFSTKYCATNLHVCLFPPHDVTLPGSHALRQVMTTHAKGLPDEKVHKMRPMQEAFAAYE